MKYILMMNTMKSGQGVPAWAKKDLQTHIAFMGLNKELHERGELVSAEGLSFPDQAKLVRARARMAVRLPMESFLNLRSFSPASGLSMSTAPSGRMTLR